MTLPNIKELEKLLKMCRKQGITDLTMDGMSFKFGDIPPDNKQVEEQEIETMPDGTPLPPGVTAEQMMFYSSQPDPLEGRQ